MAVQTPNCQVLAPSSGQPAPKSRPPQSDAPRGGNAGEAKGQKWPHAEPLTSGRVFGFLVLGSDRAQWENTAEAHNKLLIYGPAFGHKKHAAFIVFNQLEKIWQKLIK